MIKQLSILLLSLFLFFPTSAYALPVNYAPVPTGSPNSCILQFQNKLATDKCADCIILNSPEIRQAYNAANNTQCTNAQIVTHWCNGGLGAPIPKSDCDGIKNGICSQSPDNACVIPTLPPGQLPSLTPSPPATVNTAGNPRGCGILYTSGIPSCWCNNGGGQGLCGNLPLDGPGGCRDLCQKGLFNGPQGYTHCFMMKDNKECASNSDGTYKFCEKRCLAGSPGFSQTVGCQYPNNTVFSQAQFDASCILAYNSSSNFSFFGIIDRFIKGVARLIDVNLFAKKAVRVPGLQKADCNPYVENCTFE